MMQLLGERINEEEFPAGDYETDFKVYGWLVKPAGV